MLSYDSLGNVFQFPIVAWSGAGQSKTEKLSRC